MRPSRCRVRINKGHELKKIARNDPCPCGSGKKFKQCCALSASRGAGGTAQGLKTEVRSVATVIQTAITHHRQGELPDAERLYRQVLADHPRHVDALHLLGVLTHQRGQHQLAVDFISRAIECCALTRPPIQPSPTLFNNLGEACRALGHFDDALTHYRQALALRPDYGEAFYNMGQVFSDQENTEEAIVAYRRAISANPKLALAHHNLGIALKKQGCKEEAARCFAMVVELEPGNEIARHLLSSVTGGNPDRAPSHYVEALFDKHADTFDTHLVNTLRYGLPLKIAAIARHELTVPLGEWDVLDLGCGTGLVGEALTDSCRCLVGVDLSRKMLDKANGRGLYQRLVHSDLQPMLKSEAPASYDLVIAADVFVYLGNIEEIMREVRRVLRGGGLVIFSVEAIEEALSKDFEEPSFPGYQLLGTGRYAHSSGYIEDVARQFGFEVGQIAPTPIRLENQIPIPGWLAVLRG